MKLLTHYHNLKCIMWKWVRTVLSLHSVCTWSVIQCIYVRCVFEHVLLQLPIHFPFNHFLTCTTQCVRICNKENSFLLKTFLSYHLFQDVDVVYANMLVVFITIVYKKRSETMNNYWYAFSFGPEKNKD